MSGSCIPQSERLVSGFEGDGGIGLVRDRDPVSDVRAGGTLDRDGPGYLCAGRVDGGWHDGPNGLPPCGPVEGVPSLRLIGREGSGELNALDREGVRRIVEANALLFLL